MRYCIIIIILRFFYFFFTQNKLILNVLLILKLREKKKIILHHFNHSHSSEQFVKNSVEVNFKRHEKFKIIKISVTNFLFKNKLSSKNVAYALSNTLFHFNQFLLKIFHKEILYAFHKNYISLWFTKLISNVILWKKNCCLFKITFNFNILRD